MFMKFVARRKDGRLKEEKQKEYLWHVPMEAQR